MPASLSVHRHQWRVTAFSVAILLAQLVECAIDRRAVLQRHDPTIGIKSDGSVVLTDVLSLGNGAFAVNVDVTGMQSLNSTYAALFDLNTLADWGWHSTPWNTTDAAGALPAYNFTYFNVTVDGSGATRPVPYYWDSTYYNNVSFFVTGWMMANPHRLMLGQTSLRTCADPGCTSTLPLTLPQVQAGNASMDLWSGAVSSHSTLAPTAAAASVDVSVVAAVHGDIDAVAWSVSWSAPGAAMPPIALRIAFPYGSQGWGPGASDWTSDDAHTTTLTMLSPQYASFARTLDSDAYRVDCNWNSSSWSIQRAAPHAFDFIPGSALPAAAGAVELVCVYAPANGVYPAGAWMPWLQAKATATATALTLDGAPSFADVVTAAGDMWASYWSESSFLDLASGTNDPRAFELERRIVLSQQQLRVHDAGAEPPQETGLLCNSWSGKHHSEMRFWHQSHWAFWNHTSLLQRSDGWYIDQIPNATSYAAFQGYAGTRWLKETATVANRSGIDVKWCGGDALPFPFNGGDSSTFGPLMLWESAQVQNAAVVWQQPHPIWMADAQRRAVNASSGPVAAQAVMTALQDVVYGSADFLASFLWWNATDGHFWMGPPLYGAEEDGDGITMRNPSFELVYWALALDIANEWRQLQGLPRNAQWDNVSANTYPPVLDLGAAPGTPTYSFNLDCACVFSLPGCPADRYNRTQCAPMTSHPSIIAFYGTWNGRAAGDKYGVDVGVFNNTLQLVLSTWGFGTNTTGANVWGWDFPMIAAAMVRTGWAPDAVVDALLLDVVKNSYTNVGHNFQENQLPAYLPGNGGLLLTTAMMAAGSTNSPAGFFPADWGAQAEGFVVAYP